jgi:hypothetical protein
MAEQGSAKRRSQVDDLLDGKQIIVQLRVIERLFVARDQAHIFAVLERQCSVAVELYFVKPIALGEFFDRQGLHRLNERKAHVSI